MQKSVTLPSLHQVSENLPVEYLKDEEVMQKILWN